MRYTIASQMVQNVPFGWAAKQTLWASEQHFHCRKTLLSDSAIISGWSKMNIQYAKAPFQDKTLASRMVCNAIHLSKIPLEKIKIVAKSEPAQITWK
jgi:hypothetical protein